MSIRKTKQEIGWGRGQQAGGAAWAGCLGGSQEPGQGCLREHAENLGSLERNCKSPMPLVRMFCLGRSSNGQAGGAIG